MRNFKRWTGLSLIAVLVVVETISSAQSFTITGQHITVASQSTWAATNDKSSDSDEPSWSAASIVVTYESTGQNGESEVIELAKGQFDDGTGTISGEIDEPVVVKISASVDEEAEPIFIDALLEPGRDIKFAIIEYE